MEIKAKIKSTKILLDLLDPKLRTQLQEYADREAGGNVSLSARRAIIQFLKEVK